MHIVSTKSFYFNGTNNSNFTSFYMITDENQHDQWSEDLSIYDNKYAITNSKYETKMKKWYKIRKYQTSINVKINVDNCRHDC